MTTNYQTTPKTATKTAPKPAPKTAAKTPPVSPGADKRAAQLELIQRKLAAQKAKADEKNAAAAKTKMQFTPERVKEIFVWTEVLGEPKCRKRHKRRSRLTDM